MARVEDHCEDCFRELGDRFEEVNKWLDGLSDLGPDHRDVKHNELGLKKVKEK